MLRIDNLKAGYNGMEILHEVNLEVRPAEIVALIGPNGAGKSTLLKSIFNLCKIYSGKIIFKDKDITKLPTHQLIYQGVSYVPQGRQVFSNLSVRENLEMGAFIMRDKEVVKRNIQDVYNKFPFLKERENELAANLSGGEQQMLAIARALMAKPKAILMDEPSTGLAPLIVTEIFGVIKRLKEEGNTILLIEQNARMALKISDRAYVMESGRIALDGNAQELLEVDSVQRSYLGV
ncbi:MAG: ABC transporter ATP-binding protein [Desulfobacteraceae bacterium]|nr:ABC transporter ATP-binding protein [Desulfobacteraceae bacterium]